MRGQRGDDRKVTSGIGRSQVICIIDESMQEYFDSAMIVGGMSLAIDINAGWTGFFSLEYAER